ncbi:MAG: flagellar export protein FliJ [Steroidobacter sp.]
MRRSDRLEPVQKVVDDTERRLAEHLAASERLLNGCEQKLNELTGYRDDYTKGFAHRAGQGMGARELMDYQAFMSRLNEAIAQQGEVVERARADRDAQHKRWQEAAQRSKVLTNVIENWEQQELRELARREQIESDERAQRPRMRVHE